jgi:hypothetical protein
MRVRRIVRSVSVAAMLATLMALGWASTILACTGGATWPR